MQEQIRGWSFSVSPWELDIARSWDAGWLAAQVWGIPPPLSPMVREPVNHKPSQSNASHLGEGAHPPSWDTGYSEIQWPPRPWMFLPGSWQLSSSFGLVAAHCPHPVYLLPMPHRPHGHSSLASGTEEQQPAGSVPGQLSQQVPHTFSVSPGPVLTPPV